MHHTSLFMKIFYDDKKLFDKIIHMFLKIFIIFGVVQCSGGLLCGDWAVTE